MGYSSEGESERKANRKKESEKVQVKSRVSQKEKVMFLFYSSVAPLLLSTSV
jgi:hypothetical protein